MTDKKVWISGNYGLVVGIIYALLYGVLSYFSVYAQDDYFFGHIYGDYLFRNGVFPGLEPWLDYVAHAFTYANGRLPDKAMPLVMLIPRGIYAVMNVFAVFLILTNGAMLSSGRRSGSIYILAMSAIMLFMPWRDYTLQRCMFVNYIAAMAVISVWLRIFVSTRQVRKGVNILLFLFSVLAGTWHEMFTASLLILAASLCMGSSGFISDRKRIWMIAGLCTGLLAVVSAKGFWFRIFLQYFIPQSYSVKNLLEDGWIVLLTSGLIIADSVNMLLCPTKRKVLGKRLWGYGGYILIAAITSVSAFYFGFPAPRLWWLADFISVPVLFVFIRRILCRYRFLSRMIAVASVVAVGVILVCSVILQCRLYHEDKEIVSRYVEGRGAQVYYDASVYRLGAIHSPLIIQSELYGYWWQNVFAQALLSQKEPDSGRLLDILPEEMRDEEGLRLTDVGNGFYVTPEKHLLVDNNLNREMRSGYLFFTTESGDTCDMLVLISRPVKIRKKELRCVTPVFRRWRRKHMLESPLRIE